MHNASEELFAAIDEFSALVPVADERDELITFVSARQRNGCPTDVAGLEDLGRA